MADGGNAVWQYGFDASGTCRINLKSVIFAADFMAAQGILPSSYRINIKNEKDIVYRP
jgi:hypothetical protein